MTYGTGQVPLTSDPRLRLWPAIVIVILQWLIIILPGKLTDNAMLMMYGMMFGPLLGFVFLLIWWTVFSRVPAMDRLLTPLVFLLIGGTAAAAYDPNLGLFGILMYALPAATTAWVVWLLISAKLDWAARLAGLGVVFTLAFGVFSLLRFEGVTGDFSAELPFRWQPTNEDKRRAAGDKVRPRTAADAEPVKLQAGDWPGFRGPNRDSRLTAVSFDPNWTINKPREVWRQRIGPGWSSYAVIGSRIYTQEQRDKNYEAVVCYDAKTGEEIWKHVDEVRFTEPIAGPGPRATPTFHDGRILALGAKGNLNCLDAATGKRLWTRDIVADSGAKVPEWGFSASPWVAHDIVSVIAGAEEGKSVLGYRVANGEIAWTGGDGTRTYSSVQSARLRGVEQLLAVSNLGLTSFEPANGKVLWQADWDAGPQIARCIQPAIVDESDVLIGTGLDLGTQRVHLNYDGDKWSSKEVWTAPKFKPYYNDMVLHKGHAYGIDSSFLVCVNLEDGKTLWKARGYGNGQLLLLADQNLVLVLTEAGDVALVETNPQAHKEVSKFKAIEGKTWNHPVIAHGKLFVRNGAEAACFELPAAGARKP